MFPRPKGRRQTLGSVSTNRGTNVGNRRQSVDPSNGLGAPPKARPPRGRASMIPSMGRENMVPPTPPSVSAKNHQVMSTGRRRSSVGGDRRQSVIPPPVATKHDPRPFSEKSHQQECIKKLLKFLLDNSYEHPISHKSLSKPSGKDFNNIVTFLLRRIDPSFQDGTMKIEDEVAMNFKAIGYPFTVSKTALVAAGSPHTWPSLLGALTWLVERLECMGLSSRKDEDRGEFQSLEDLEAKTDRAFFDYLGSAYKAFLRGDEALTEQLENELADIFERDDNIIELEIEQFNDKNSLVLERINKFAVGENDLKDYIKKRDGYATDLEQFKDLIQQMVHHVETLEEKRKNRAQELEDTNRQLEVTNAHVSQLRDSVKAQILSMDDLLKLKTDLKGIEEAIERAVILKNDRRTTMRAVDSEVGKLWDEAESRSMDYNSRVGELSVLSVLKKVKSSEEIRKISMSGGDSETIFDDADLVDAVMPTLGKFRKYCSGELSGLKMTYQEALDSLERSEDIFTESHETLKIVEEKMDKCEEMVAAERDAQAATIRVRQREAESIEGRVGSLRDPAALEEKLAGFESRLAVLESHRMQFHEESSTRQLVITTEIEKAVDAMGQYDQFCLEKSAELATYRKASTSKFGQLRCNVE